MYILLNKLFGWDYIAWHNIADSGIARIKKDGSGRAYYFRYKIIPVVDIVSNVNDVVWLTCTPEKYLSKITKKSAGAIAVG